MSGWRINTKSVPPARRMIRGDIRATGTEAAMYLSVNTVITVPSADPPDDDGDGKKAHRHQTPW